jgi:biopolymer transport protein ExbB/TolQ
MGTTLDGIAGGGPIMLLIVAVGIVGLGVVLERGYVIVVRSKNNGRAFIERVIVLVRAGKIEEAIKQCAASTAALPDIGLLILRSRSRVESDLQNIADAASLMLLPRLTRRMNYLPALAFTAIALGLIGAFVDLHAAFVAASASTTSAQLWPLLASATTPLVLGLVVAAVLVLGRAYLVSQAEAISEQLREFSARLINALIDRPDVRLGHR